MSLCRWSCKSGAHRGTFSTYQQIWQNPILGDDEPGLLQQEGVRSHVGSYLNNKIGENHGHSSN
jgi:hypothetical protein